MDAKPAAAMPRRAAIEPRRSPESLVGGLDAVVAVDGWAAGVAWIEVWARGGDWIVLDRGAHRDVCRCIAPDLGQVLWYEPRDIEEVWAMLAELRSRSDTREILVVRGIVERAVFDSPAIAALGALCRDYRATLLVVIEAR